MLEQLYVPFASISRYLTILEGPCSSSMVSFQIVPHTVQRLPDLCPMTTDIRVTLPLKAFG